ACVACLGCLALRSFVPRLVPAAGATRVRPQARTTAGLGFRALRALCAPGARTPPVAPRGAAPAPLVPVVGRPEGDDFRISHVFRPPRLAAAVRLPGSPSRPVCRPYGPGSPAAAAPAPDPGRRPRRSRPS